MKLGLMGLGLMGAAMAERLLEQGWDLSVYNRSRQKAEALQPAGARLTNSPLELLQQTELIILMLSDYAAIQALLKPAASALAGKLILQMGTIAPAQSRELADWLAAHQADYLEAPVLGSVPQSRQGSLLTMVAGEQACFKKASACLQALSARLWYLGEVGKAAEIKLALNQMIGSLNAAFGLSIAYLQKRQIPAESFMEILRQSHFYAQTFDRKLPAMLAGNFLPTNFPTKHLLKDMRLFLDESRQQQLNTPMLEGLESLLQQAVASGWAETDYASLYQVLQIPAQPESSGV